MRKISEIEGREAFTVTAGIITPIANMMQDPEAMALLRPEARPKDLDAEAYGLQLMAKGLPAIMVSHQDDVIKIMSLIEGVTEDEYLETLNMQKLMNDFTSLLKDEAFRGFLS